MQVNRCASCMKETGAYPCPHCGFDPAKEPQLSFALPRNTILHGRYLVGKVLGQGGFGITYAGWDLALEVKTAIKEYYPAGQVSRQSALSCELVWNNTAQSTAARNAGMESFLKEARKMARVDRVPQVVRVRDTFHENGTAYIIMDFVEGETLKAHLERKGPLPFRQAMDIFRPVIAAMEEVHKEGLIHRDLSPDNIMLAPGGGVRILDLGAAKDLAVNQGASSMLVTKGGFSPLEQYGQRGGSGPWTDVYAMAATIYYTLTGLLPPTAIDRLDDDELQWDLPALESMGAPAKEALQKALAVSAKNRTQSMAGLLEGLERRDEPEPVPVPKPVPAPEPKPDPKPQPEPEPDPKPQPEPEPKPHPKPQPEPERKPEPVPPPPPKPKKKLLVIAAVCAALVLAAAIWMMQHRKAGPSVTWKLDRAGVMTISGSGVMSDYSWSTDRPWDSHKDDITSVKVEPGVTKIGERAFWDCTNLSSITLPESVTEIGERAFEGCASLSSITLPESVTEIGERAFWGCTNLSSITLPESVNKIGWNAFQGCTSLSSITLPKSVTYIGGCAFQGCASLSSITIPEGVTKIVSSAFYGCTSLSSITLPKSVTYIGGNAFEGCTSLSSITIPVSVTEIKSGAFSGCIRLTDVYYGGTEEQWRSSGIEMMGNERLWNATLHTTIASGVAGPSVNWKLDSAGVLTLSGTGRTNNFNTFAKISTWDDYLDDITSVVVEPWVAQIGEWCFYECHNLSSVTIPKSVTKIDKYAFQDCTSLTNVYYGGTEEQWRSIVIENGNDKLTSAAIHYNS